PRSPALPSLPPFPLRLPSPFSFHCYGPHRSPHSFPTRRSSDLTFGQERLTYPGGKATARFDDFTFGGGIDIDLGSRLVVNAEWIDRKSTRLNSSHVSISYAVFCLKKKNDRHRPHALGLY